MLTPRDHTALALAAAGLLLAEGWAIVACRLDPWHPVSFSLLVVALVFGALALSVKRR